MREWRDIDGWDPTRWATTLLEPVGPGDRGEPAHEAGTSVEVAQPVLLVGVAEEILVPAIRLSVVLTRQAARQAINAEVRKAAALESLSGPEPGGRGFPDGVMLRSLQDQASLFAYLESASATAVLCLAALEAFSAEQLPAGFEFDDGLTRHDHASIMRLGVEKRLSRVLSQACEVENPHGSELWSRLLRLKRLRDVVHHVSVPALYGVTSPAVTVMHRLLNDAPPVHVETVVLFMRHYGLPAPDLFEVRP